MNGLILCAALAVGVSFLLYAAGARGMILSVAGVALIGGTLSFRAVQHDGVAVHAPPLASRTAVVSLAPVRHAFTGQFTGGERWLMMADSLAARGNTANAAGILIAGVKQHPRDYSLWTGLGTMLTEHGGGLDPGAELAFERAIELAPSYPAPRYFYGVAKLRSGDRAGALAQWRAVLANAPANASWRTLVEEQISATGVSRVPS